MVSHLFWIVMQDGDTLLHIASEHGYTQMVLTFLERGVPLHMPNKVLELRRCGTYGLHQYGFVIVVIIARQAQCVCIQPQSVVTQI